LAITLNQPARLAGGRDDAETGAEPNRQIRERQQKYELPRPKPKRQNNAAAARAPPAFRSTQSSDHGLVHGRTLGDGA